MGVHADSIIRDATSVQRGQWQAWHGKRAEQATANTTRRAYRGGGGICGDGRRYEEAVNEGESVDAR